jgi:hypothetical protein
MGFLTLLEASTQTRTVFAMELPRLNANMRTTFSALQKYAKYPPDLFYLSKFFETPPLF